MAPKIVLGKKTPLLHQAEIPENTKNQLIRKKKTHANNYSEISLLFAGIKLKKIKNVFKNHWLHLNPSLLLN